MSIKGRCLCKAIQYEIDHTPKIAGVCHCLNCQRQAGSAFSTFAGVPKDEFRILSGSPKLYEDSDTVSGNTVERYFCVDCGSPLYSLIPTRPDTVLLHTGTLDDTSDFKPMFHVWCDTKQNWVDLKDDVPTFARGRQ